MCYMNILSFFFPITHATFKSKYNGEIKLKEVLGQKGIYVDDFPQSGVFMERMWRNVIANVINKMSNVKNCLLLGVGGGTAIKILKKYYPKAQVTGVDIDKVMIDIAKKHFQVESYEGVKLKVADAFLYVEKNYQSKKFDLIIVDLFIGRKNILLSRAQAFISQLKKMLDKDGLLVVNTDYKKGQHQEIEKFVTKCKKVFDNVEASMKFSQNSILFLS